MATNQPTQNVVRSSDKDQPAAVSATVVPAVPDPIDPKALEKAAKKKHGIAASRIKRGKDKKDIEPGDEVAADEFDEKDMQALIDGRAVIVQGVNDVG